MLRFNFEKPIIELEEKIKKLENITVAPEQKTAELEKMNNELNALKKKIYHNLTGWQRVQMSRHPDRPHTSDYIQNIFSDFTEFHGDRKAGDDPAIIGGFARLQNETIMLIGHQKGKTLKENQIRNFGMASPEGYRKANRLMKLAEKYNKAIVTFIDTPGALPSVEAEARGIGEAIGTNIFDMLQLKVPVISIIIGEGAAAGALGIAVCDRLLMMENTWLAVISPEFCSSILWQSYNHKEEAAEQMKLTAFDLLKAKIIDGIIKEPLGGAHLEPDSAFRLVKSAILKNLKELWQYSPDERIFAREKKYSNIGIFSS